MVHNDENAKMDNGSPASSNPTRKTRHQISWGRAILFAIAWQLIPASWLMWDAWNSASTKTLVLRATVFLVAPILASLVHRSWKVGIVALLLPVFAIGVMMTVFMMIMPTGKW